jgi:hypothetical protein
MKRVLLSYDETGDPDANRAFRSNAPESWLDLTRTPSNGEHVTVNYAVTKVWPMGYEGKTGFHGRE